MLETRNLHKYYGQLHVLKGINLQIHTGQITTIVGPSGAGKSTLLHILGTLDTPDEGTVAADGIILQNLGEQALARFRNLEIGFVFQFHNLLPEFTALENIAMPGYIAGKPVEELHNRATELAQMLGVAHRLSHKPAELSGGEQQRIAVARALINSPKIVFADEPSGNLDTRNAEELHQLFFKLRDELGQTFVIVTHNESLANATDRKITIVDGRIAGDESK
ncbi:ABC transporter ATP-binding protein [Rhodoflexus caldus]|uniref:ABC transporter ATP-binding protein n=1 Tax=Rhodoflexus caldus TaxID=2891236 RepID=UPI00202A738A|nr:ABC transporter ATP-binding protein [Rhodoflexus caldus]